MLRRSFCRSNLCELDISGNVLLYSGLDLLIADAGVCARTAGGAWGRRTAGRAAAGRDATRRRTRRVGSADAREGGRRVAPERFNSVAPARSFSSAAFTLSLVMMASLLSVTQFGHACCVAKLRYTLSLMPACDQALRYQYRRAAGLLRLPAMSENRHM